MNNFINKMIILLFLDIYISIIYIAALSRLKLPVRFPSRNDSNGRRLSFCLQCRLLAYQALARCSCRPLDGRSARYPYCFLCWGPLWLYTSKKVWIIK
jgi:hypothetical protein